MSRRDGPRRLRPSQGGKFMPPVDARPPNLLVVERNEHPRGQRSEMAFYLACCAQFIGKRVRRLGFEPYHVAVKDVEPGLGENYASPLLRFTNNDWSQVLADGAEQWEVVD